MKLVEVTEGSSAIILGIPHSGTFVPADILAKLAPNNITLPDTDWHVDKLYGGLLPNATMVKTNVHRYVVDPNRAPDDKSLYPGQNTTSLCPTITFDGEPLWQAGHEPAPDEITDRAQSYHAPYHTALREQIERVKAAHGIAVLYDCHSIRSQVPFLFEGTLPDLNIGDNDGQSCSPLITSAAARICKSQPNFSCVVNGRFKGGWTTRHYGEPTQGVHAIQMELVQSAYLVEERAPFDYDSDKAENLRHVLRQVLETIESVATSGEL